MSTTKERVAFQLMAPEARQVFVAGSFNEWSPDADAMKQNKSGLWKKEKKLAPGTYEYKFIVDGSWVLDPDCQASVSDHHGGVNNVVTVQPADRTAENQAAYIDKIRAKLDEWNAEIAKIEAKAAQAKDASKAKYQSQIESLRSMGKEFEQKLEELRHSGGQAWDEMKEGIESAWKTLGKSIKSAASKFK